MRIAILSDVHANLEALEAVLARATDEGAEATFVLGDIVGYGADPQAVVERLSARSGAFLLAGNHDLAVTNRFDTTWFNSAAAAAVRWTQEAISSEVMDALGALEPRGTRDGALLVHGSVVDPAAEYVVRPSDAEASFAAEAFGLCFFGHTHLPMRFATGPEGVTQTPLAEGATVALEDGERVMLNPGSVGQPRDGDPRASFMIYDDAARVVVVHRVAYDVDTASGKIRDAGLPRMLADRLWEGR